MGRQGTAGGRRRRRWRAVAGFFKTLPGALTAIGTLLAAVAGLLTALAQVGLIQVRSPIVVDPPGARAAAAATVSPTVAPATVLGETAQEGQAGEPASSVVYLEEIRPVQQPGSWYQTGSQTVNGRSYARSIAVSQPLRGRTVTTIFNLGRHYAQLRFTLGLSDRSDPPLQSKCQVFADEKLIYDSGSIMRGSSSEIVRNIGDAFDLTLSCTPTQSISVNGEVVFGDARLAPKPNQVTPTSPP